jgi:hypothetical protein
MYGETQGDWLLSMLLNAASESFSTPMQNQGALHSSSNLVPPMESGWRNVVAVPCASL